MTEQCKAKVPIPGTDPQQLRWCGHTERLTMTANGPRCPQHSPPARSTSEHPQRIRAIIACNKLTLDDEERHELAAMLVGHEGSWRTLSEEHAKQIAVGCEAFLMIQALLLLRRQQGSA